MPINLTPYLTSGGGLGEVPQHALSDIRTQAANGAAQVQLGNTMVIMRVVFSNFFRGSVNTEGLSGGDLQSVLSNIAHLERSLNGGLSGRDVLLRIPVPSVPPPRSSVMQTGLLLEKIEKCSFNVSSSSLKGAGDALTCPITLCIPEHGVIMKNSSSSDVCALYDKTSLTHIVSTSTPHPLSRQKITDAMIVKESSCYFDGVSGNIRYISGDITRL
ncbi:T3SS effector NleG family protein [Escherichia albertii]|uniref:T3SS effector NleG family protein n=1 Tax=Escherichia albertii TaxID=208962 RepID=UPI002362E849|nr:T3SS effector NleG family protein [Escherichia albertii]WDB26895.1 T3SS effector NleG family protein [Escherichia albertii]WDC22851.1 T3SS effector NleG family protein [Escherichia albertii]